MSEPKSINRINVNLPFPYPMKNSESKTIWPYKEEGFVLIQAKLDLENKCVVVNETASIFTLIKMGFFGINSNKELTHFYLMESINLDDHTQGSHQTNKNTNFSLGYYSLNSVEIPPALVKFGDENETNKIEKNDSDTKSEATLTSLKLSFEEAYFLSYVFGLLRIFKNSEEFFDLKELWNCFQNETSSNQNEDLETNPFCVRYAAYHYFRSKGWIVRNGFKFGTDYLLYKEGPPFYHALYSVILVHQIGFNEQPNKRFKWNEVSGLTRVSKNARKKFVICTVTIPGNIESSNDPRSIKEYQIELMHVNRWNSNRGEFDQSKLFLNNDYELSLDQR
ncbi:tRNA-splicing endonuclease subunit Sen2 [Blomia tropicalis]|nr:tRNA-splicing endonuclease subunit Sen2 [Blomia tropicalis]